ncbi:MAG: extracellular solute-binding protein [Dehalococcoidia bacterium]|nr:extracellular solute-binding protein [Dehalococcoidia bacterium]
MRRFWYSFAVLLLISGMVLVACAAPSAPSPAPSPQTPSTGSPAPAGPVSDARAQLLEAAYKEGEVQLWANTFDNQAKVLKPFHDKYPGITVKVWDASTGNDVINKLVEEGKAGKVSGDIFFSGEGDLVTAITAGVMAEYPWDNDDWPNQPDTKLYINYGTNPRLPAFNTNVIPVDQGPKSWEDMATNRWVGKSPVFSFSGEDGPLLFAYMWRLPGDVLNWAKAEKYWTDVVTNNKPAIVRGYSGPLELLVSGEYGIMLPVASGRTVLEYALIGAPIAIVPVGKTPGITQSLGMVKNPAHPNATKVFLDWFTSEGGQLSQIQENLIYAIDPEITKIARANILLRDKYFIEVEPVPSKFYTPENTERASDHHLRTAGVKR